MKLSHLLPLALVSLAAAIAVERPGTMSPVGDTSFAKMSVQDRKEMIQQLSSGGLFRRDSDEAAVNVMDPADDVSFSAMNAEQRRKLIQQLQGIAKRDADADADAEEVDEEEIMSPEGDEAFSSMSAKERLSAIQRLASGSLSRRGLEGKVEADYAEMHQWMGGDDDDQYDDDDGQAEVDADPELQVYVANGNWDDEEDIPAQLAADGQTADEDDNAPDRGLRRRGVAPKSTKKPATKKAKAEGDDLVVVNVKPKCLTKTTNPGLQCRIMHARRCWCKENKSTCRKKHPWLYNALFVNKAKKALSAAIHAATKHAAATKHETKTKPASTHKAKVTHKPAKKPDTYGASTKVTKKQPHPKVTKTKGPVHSTPISTTKKRVKVASIPGGVADSPTTTTTKQPLYTVRTIVWGGGFTATQTYMLPTSTKKPASHEKRDVPDEDDDESGDDDQSPTGTLPVRPSCMDKYDSEEEIPEWCTEIQERRVWCFENHEECGGKYPWLAGALVKDEQSEIVGGDEKLSVDARIGS